MKLEEIEFYEESGPLLDNFTVVTCSPQTNARWVAKSFISRQSGKLIECGVSFPVDESDLNAFVVVTNIELPVLSGNCQADGMFDWLSNLREKVRCLVVCITLSEALTDSFYETGKQLGRLAVRLLYDAQLIIQLTPLETGRARDITGRFVISKGPSRTRTVNERELFYFVNSHSVELSMKN